MNRKIDELKEIRLATNIKYKMYTDEIIKLFTDRKIEKFKTAIKLATKLASRGKGPESAIKELETYKDKKSITGRLTVERYKNYSMSALVTYEKNYKLLMARNKKQLYTYKDSNVNERRVIRAKSKAEAEAIFRKEIEDLVSYDDYEGSQYTL